MRAEAIIEAMSLIDESYILEARTEYKPAEKVKALSLRELLTHSKRAKFVAFAASAACACLIVLLAIPMLANPPEPASPEDPLFPSENTEPEPPMQADPTLPGFSVETDVDGKWYIGAYSTDRTQEIKITEITDKSISFRFSKSLSGETYVYLYLNNKSDPNGQTSVVTTASGYTPTQGEVLKQGTVKIYVNGKYHYDKLPQEAGEYEIKIDFSALCDENTELSEISLTGFPKIPIRKLRERNSDTVYGQADKGGLY